MRQAHTTFAKMMREIRRYARRNEAKVQTLGALWELPGALVEEWTHILEQLFK
jgi:hypothetical protein